ncbi:MAG: HAD family hydrolase [Solirubrobacteraceae bacterium]
MIERERIACGCAPRPPGCTRADDRMTHGDALSAARWRLLLVDLDGTLWSADAAYRRATRGRWDGTTPVADAAAACGLDAQSWAREIEEHCGSVTLASSAVNLLREFRRAGGKVGCVTNLPRWIAAPILDSLELASDFDVLVFNEHGLPAKPHADPLRRAVAALGHIPLSEVLFVGDSDDDRECALSAGVAFARVVWQAKTARWGLGRIETGAAFEGTRTRER